MVGEDLKYPYFVADLLREYKKCVPGSERAKELRGRIAANIGDAEVVDRLIGPSVADENASSNKEESPKPSTLDTIDSFLDKFGSKKLTGSYVTEKEEQENDLNLLRQLIKNQRYSEALEIIEQRNLKNTQKNIYFADQIRFIKKLMAIENHKNKNQRLMHRPYKD